MQLWAFVSEGLSCRDVSGLVESGRKRKKHPGRLERTHQTVFYSDVSWRDGGVFFWVGFVP